MNLGKARDNSAMLELSDQKGRVRLRIIVAADGTPRIERWTSRGG